MSGRVPFVLEQAGPETTLPALLWAYGIAITPLSYMTQRSQPEFGSVVITIGAQFAVVAMTVVVMTKGPDLTTLIIACAAPIAIATVLQVTVAFLAMKEAYTQRSAEQAHD